MPSCPRCRTEYHATEPHCPKCGAPRPVFGPSRNTYVRRPQRCSPHIHACLYLARVAACLSALITFVGGIVALTEGSWGSGLLSILVATPVSLGHYVGFGLLIDYAESLDAKQNESDRDAS